MEDIAILRKIPFFRNLSTHELMNINMIAERATFSAGEDIVKEGTPCDALYIIKEGSVQVHREGKQLVTIDKDEAFGEVSFVDKGARSATVTARADTVLVKIPADSLEKLLSKEHQLGAKIYRSIGELLAKRLRETNDVLKMLIFE